MYAILAKKTRHFQKKVGERDLIIFVSATILKGGEDP